MNALFKKHIQKSLSVVPAKGKLGGYRIKMVVCNNGGVPIELTHELLFKDISLADTVMQAVHKRSFIQLDHWVFKPNADSNIKPLSLVCTARLKTQLYERIEY